MCGLLNRTWNRPYYRPPRRDRGTRRTFPLNPRLRPHDRRGTAPPCFFSYFLFYLTYFYRPRSGVLTYLKMSNALWILRRSRRNSRDRHEFFPPSAHTHTHTHILRWTHPEKIIDQLVCMVANQCVGSMRGHVGNCRPSISSTPRGSGFFHHPPQIIGNASNGEKMVIIAVHSVGKKSILLWICKSKKLGVTHLSDSHARN